MGFRKVSLSTQDRERKRGMGVLVSECMPLIQGAVREHETD